MTVTGGHIFALAEEDKLGAGNLIDGFTSAEGN